MVNVLGFDALVGPVANSVRKVDGVAAKLGARRLELGEESRFVDHFGDFLHTS